MIILIEELVLFTLKDKNRMQIEEAKDFSSINTVGACNY